MPLRHYTQEEIDLVGLGPLSVYQTCTLPMMSSVSLVQFPYEYGYHIMDSSINY
jgi:hypothetical protein